MIFFWDVNNAAATLYTTTEKRTKNNISNKNKEGEDDVGVVSHEFVIEGVEDYKTLGGRVNPISYLNVDDASMMMRMIHERPFYNSCCCFQLPREKLICTNTCLNMLSSVLFACDWIASS